MSDPARGWRMLLPPRPQGLYDPAFEHDACGVSFVVDMKGRRSHGIVEQGLDCLCNLQHRGASGSEVNTGDGAGILIQIPDAFLRTPRLRPPRRRRLRHRHRLPSDRRRRRPLRHPGHRQAHRSRGPGGARLARGADRPSMLGHGSPRPCPASARSSSVAGSPARTGIDLERRVFIAAQADRARVPDASTSRACRAGPSSTRGC